MDRNATDKEKANPCPTLKDNDFLDDKRTIDLGPEQKQSFLERLKRDVNVKRIEPFFSFAHDFHLSSSGSFWSVNIKWVIHY